MRLIQHVQTRQNKTIQYTDVSVVEEHILEHSVLFCRFTRHDKAGWLLCLVYEERDHRLLQR